MRHFLTVALATTALLAAAPSFGQSTEDALRGFRSLLQGQQVNPYEQDLNDQERRLTDLVEESARDGRIGHREADRAFEELRTIRGEEDDLRRRDEGQLTPGDHDYIRDRLVHLDREIDQMREAGGPREDEQGDRHDIWRGAPASFHEREEWLEQRIRRGMEDGSLDRDEARRGFDQLRAIRLTEEDMRRDHGRLTDDDRADLDQQLDGLGRQLRWNRMSRN